MIYTRLGKYDEAVRDIEAASRALKDPTVDYHLARAYLKMGKPDDAAKRPANAALKAGLTSATLEARQSRERAETGTR